MAKLDSKPTPNTYYYNRLQNVIKPFCAFFSRMQYEYNLILRKQNTIQASIIHYFKLNCVFFYFEFQSACVYEILVRIILLIHFVLMFMHVCLNADKTCDTILRSYYELIIRRGKIIKLHSSIKTNFAFIVYKVNMYCYL